MARDKNDLALAAILAAVTVIALVAVAVLAALGKSTPEILGHTITAGLAALATLARSLGTSKEESK